MCSELHLAVLIKKEHDNQLQLQDMTYLIMATHSFLSVFDVSVSPIAGIFG